jgi:dTDP-4-dehydrorhamnose reductase
MKVLVLGKTGMAGHVVYEYLKSSGKFDVFGTSRKKDSDVQVDILGDYKILESEAARSFDYVINCIGVLIKESQQCPTRAILVNAWFPHYLEECFKNTSTKILHISTDCIYSGKTGFYKETAVPDETNFYGRSKALGEIVNGKDLTLRTSIIGPELKDGDGLFHWFMSLKEGEEIKGYTNVFWNGITTLDLAKAIERIMLEEANLAGLYHLVPRIAISKCNLLETINQVFERKIVIKPFRLLKSSNKVLMDTRNEFKFMFADYHGALMTLRQWIRQHGFEEYSKYR